MIVLDHIALGVRQLSDALPWVVGSLGGVDHDCGPGSGFIWAQWRYANGGVLEVLEPEGDPGGFLYRFLDQRGPGVHHVTFKVPELAAACDHARSLGYEIVRHNDADPGWKEAFLHPRQAQGIVVQMAESNPEHHHDEPARITLPARPADPPPPVDLLGLRLSARDERAVRRQWFEGLGGDCTERDGFLEFVWKDSAARIQVEIRPDAPEGPLAIQVSADRTLDLSESASALGIALIQVSGADGAPA